MLGSNRAGRDVMCCISFAAYSLIVYAYMVGALLEYYQRGVWVRVLGCWCWCQLLELSKETNSVLFTEIFVHLDSVQVNCGRVVRHFGKRLK